MYPDLFEIWGFTIDTYTVVWALALAGALAWTRFRASRVYGLADEDARVTLFWGFLGILIGARLGNILMEWPLYAAQPQKLLRPWEGGISALPAILGGGLAALLVLRKKKIPAWPLAEAASLPAAALVAAGRWGCFAEGCCYGEISKVPWAVHFPFDRAQILRHPTQLYESLSALALLAVLAFIEKRFRKTGKGRAPAAFLWPLFLTGYGLIRLVVDRFRGEAVFRTPMALAWSLGLSVLGIAWLAVSVSRFSKVHREERMK